MPAGGGGLIFLQEYSHWQDPKIHEITWHMQATIIRLHRLCCMSLKSCSSSKAMSLLSDCCPLLKPSAPLLCLVSSAFLLPRQPRTPWMLNFLLQWDPNSSTPPLQVHLLSNVLKSKLAWCGFLSNFWYEKKLETNILSAFIIWQGSTCSS